MVANGVRSSWLASEMNRRSVTSDWVRAREGLFDLTEHPVQRMGESSDLGLPSIGRDPFGEISLSDAFCCFLDLGERP